MPTKRNAPKALSGREDVRPDDVTEHQYAEAWKLYSAGSPKREICKLTGITEAQFKHMYEVGGPNGMMSFLSRERLDDAILQEQRLKAIQAFGEGLAEEVKTHKRHADNLLKMAETLHATWVEYVFKPAMVKFRETGDPSYLNEISMPPGMERDLKTLSKLSSQHLNTAGDLVNKMIKATTKEVVLPEIYGAPNSVQRPASLQQAVEEAASEGLDSLRSLLPEGLETPEAIAEFLSKHRVPEVLDVEATEEGE